MTVDVPGRDMRVIPDGGTELEPRTMPVVTGRLVSMSYLMGVVRRRWRLWCATAVVGMSAGVGLSHVLPPKYTATTTLLLRHTPQISQSSSGDAMRTEAALIESRTVAQAAADRLGLPISAEKLLGQYRATPLTDDVMQISVQGPTERDALRQTEAVAEAFLSFRHHFLEQQTAAVTEVMQHRKDVLSDQLRSLNAQINNFSDVPRETTSAVVNEGLADLVARRAAANDELAELRRRTDEIQLETKSVVEGTRVIDPAKVLPRTTSRVRDSATGMVAGLIVGVGWVVLQATLSDRVRRRDEVTAALGASVAVSVGRLRGSLRDQRRRLRHRLRPRPEIARIVDHLRSVLSETPSMARALIVVSIDSDGPAAASVASLAVELVRQGEHVVVADLSAKSVLAGLFDVHGKQASKVNVGSSQSTLSLTFPNLEPPGFGGDSPLGTQVERLRDETDVVVVLATLDPTLGARHLVEWATTAVAVVTARRSSTTGLLSAAQMIRAAGLHLHSAVLLGADRNDDSVGVVEGLLPRPSVDVAAPGGSP